MKGVARAAIPGAGFALLYALTAQPVARGDGLTFVEQLNGGALAYSHIAYLPAARFLQLLGLGPDAALKLLSAISGGASVTILFLLARRMLGGEARALAAAVVLGFLPGSWFHATSTELHAFHGAFALLALLALVPALDAARLSWRSALGVAGSMAMLPASHLSGISACVASALTAARYARAKRALLAAIVAGVAVFFVAYRLARPQPKEGPSFESNVFALFYESVLHEPGFLSSLVLRTFGEALLASVPASPFLFAGLRALAARSRPQATLFALWILGYTALCAPIRDRFLGSYWVPTFGVQVILAFVALERVTTAPRFLAACACAVAPGLIALRSEWGGLAAWGVAAIALLPLCGAKESVEPSRPRLFLFAFLAAVCGAAIGLPAVFEKPIWASAEYAPARAHAREVLAFAAPGSNLVVAEPDPIVSAYWFDLLEHERPGRFFCATSIDYSPPDAAARTARGVLDMIDAALRRGETVWLVGSLDEFTPGKPSAEFAAAVRERYRREVVSGAPRRLVCLVEKR